MLRNHAWQALGKTGGSGNGTWLGSQLPLGYLNCFGATPIGAQGSPLALQHSRITPGRLWDTLILGVGLESATVQGQRFNLNATFLAPKNKFQFKWVKLEKS